MGEALDFARAIGIQEQAYAGMPKEQLDLRRMSAYRSISRGGAQAVKNHMMGAYNRGMQFSGAATQKAPAEIQADMIGQMFGVDNQIYMENEQHKMNMQQTFLSVLQHEDSMDMERRRLEAMEGDMLDQIGRVASLIAMF